MAQKTDCSNIKSFLSPSVHKMLVEIGKETDDLITETDSYLTEEFTFNWSKISFLTEDIQGDNYNIHKESAEVINPTIQRLWPVFSEAKRKTQNLNQANLEALKTLFRWTRKESEILNCLLSYCSTVVGNIEAILLLTSVLERSLGNVNIHYVAYVLLTHKNNTLKNGGRTWMSFDGYTEVFLLKGRNVPFLLRDLLSTKELKSIMGQTPVTFLQLLIGTPVALNLRNVVWHGFPNPNEIRTEFAATLFVTIASVGKLLAQQKISLEMLPHRHQISNFDYYTSILQNTFPDINKFVSEVRHSFGDSELIFPSHHIFWEALLDHHHNSRYGYCVLLVLPQLEHMLRNVFCLANGCPERMLTAESTSFYVTLDEILAEHLNENEPNKVRMVLGDNIFEMLRDILVYQEGPRLRDKVSHGECNIENIPKLLSNHIICIALAVIYKIQEQKVQTEEMHYVLKNNIETRLLHSRAYEMKESIVKVSEKYVSVFHPSTLLRLSIVECLKALDLWKVLPRPICTQDFQIGSWDEIVNEDKMQLKETREALNSLVLCNLGLEHSDTLEDVTAHLLLFKIYTLFRPKSEQEVLTLMRQINDSVQSTCRQVKDAFENKYTLYTSHELRSRQRETYRRMLTVLPHLHSSIICIVLIVIFKWMHLNEISSLLPKEFQALLRYLRNILRYVQNVTSLTNLEKNRWEEIGTLTLKFSNQLSSILEQN